MGHASSIGEFVKNLRSGVRTKTGMYFGWSGSAAVPRMLNELIIEILQEAGQGKRMALKIEISESGPTQIKLHLSGAVCRSLPVAEPGCWIEHRERLTNNLALMMAAMEAATVVVADSGAIGELHVTDQEIRSAKRYAKVANGITISGRVYEPSFGEVGHADFYRLGGMLQDLSILRPGLATSLKMGKSTIQLAWRYPEGLKTYLAEMDHSRWSLHPDCLHFSGERADMKVEGCLRFVHAGVPEICSWVNYRPVHGGAHYEGFGDALKGLFPDAKRGCRRVTFVTNPDMKRRVLLPHPFVAAIHLQMADPKFYGPTRDILLNEEARVFVREVAGAVLSKQWEELRSRRDP